MNDPKTTTVMEKYIGKKYLVDFSLEDLEDAFSEYIVFVLNKNTLVLPNFELDRLRVWLDDDDIIVKIIIG